MKNELYRMIIEPDKKNNDHSWATYHWQVWVTIALLNFRWLAAQEWSSIFIWINASYGRIRFVAIHEKMLYEV